MPVDTIDDLLKGFGQPAEQSVDELLAGFKEQPKKLPTRQDVEQMVAAQKQMQQQSTQPGGMLAQAPPAEQPAGPSMREQTLLEQQGMPPSGYEHYRAYMQQGGFWPADYFKMPDEAGPEKPLRQQVGDVLTSAYMKGMLTRLEPAPLIGRTLGRVAGMETPPEVQEGMPIVDAAASMYGLGKSAIGRIPMPKGPVKSFLAGTGVNVGVTQAYRGASGQSAEEMLKGLPLDIITGAFAQGIGFFERKARVFKKMEKTRPDFTKLDEFEQRDAMIARLKELHTKGRGRTQEEERELKDLRDYYRDSFLVSKDNNVTTSAQKTSPAEPSPVSGPSLPSVRQQLQLEQQATRAKKAAEEVVQAAAPIPGAIVPSGQAVEAKEFWQMTGDEFQATNPQFRKLEDGRNTYKASFTSQSVIVPNDPFEAAKSAYAIEVGEAWLKGKPVPPDILAEAGIKAPEQAVEAEQSDSILTPEELAKVDSFLNELPPMKPGETIDPETGLPVGQQYNFSKELPRDLKGAKPRFNIGMISFNPQFQSDIDKALFIVAQPKPSKRDADYMTFLQKLFPNNTPEEIRDAGKQLKLTLKERLKGLPQGGDVRVGETGIRPVSKQAATVAPATVAPVVAAQTNSVALSPQEQAKQVMQRVDDLNKEFINLAMAKKGVEGKKLQAFVEKVRKDLTDSDPIVSQAAQILFEDWDQKIKELAPKSPSNIKKLLKKAAEQRKAEKKRLAEARELNTPIQAEPGTFDWQTKAKEPTIDELKKMAAEVSGDVASVNEQEIKELLRKKEEEGGPTETEILGEEGGGAVQQEGQVDQGLPQEGWSQLRPKAGEGPQLTQSTRDNAQIIRAKNQLLELMRKLPPGVLASIQRKLELGYDYWNISDELPLRVRAQVVEQEDGNIMVVSRPDEPIDPITFTHETVHWALPMSHPELITETLKRALLKRAEDFRIYPNVDRLQLVWVANTISNTVEELKGLANLRNPWTAALYKTFKNFTLESKGSGLETELDWEKRVLTWMLDVRKTLEDSSLWQEERPPEKMLAWVENEVFAGTLAIDSALDPKQRFLDMALSNIIHPKKVPLESGQAQFQAAQPKEPLTPAEQAKRNAQKKYYAVVSAIKRGIEFSDIERLKLNKEATGIEHTSDMTVEQMQQATRRLQEVYKLGAEQAAKRERLSTIGSIKQLQRALSLDKEAFQKEFPVDLRKAPTADLVKIEALLKERLPREVDRQRGAEADRMITEVSDPQLKALMEKIKDESITKAGQLELIRESGKKVPSIHPIENSRQSLSNAMMLTGAVEKFAPYNSLIEKGKDIEDHLKKLFYDKFTEAGIKRKQVTPAIWDAAAELSFEWRPEHRKVMLQKADALTIRLSKLFDNLWHDPELQVAVRREFIRNIDKVEKEVVAERAQLEERQAGKEKGKKPYKEEKYQALKDGLLKRLNRAYPGDATDVDIELARKILREGGEAALHQHLLQAKWGVREHYFPSEPATPLPDDLTRVMRKQPTDETLSMAIDSPEEKGIRVRIEGAHRREGIGTSKKLTTWHSIENRMFRVLLGSAAYDDLEAFARWMETNEFNNLKQKDKVYIRQWVKNMLRLGNEESPLMKDLNRLTSLWFPLYLSINAPRFVMQNIPQFVLGATKIGPLRAARAIARQQFFLGSPTFKRVLDNHRFHRQISEMDVLQRNYMGSYEGFEPMRFYTKGGTALGGGVDSLQREISFQTFFGDADITFNKLRRGEITPRQALYEQRVEQMPKPMQFYIAHLVGTKQYDEATFQIAKYKNLDVQGGYAMAERSLHQQFPTVKMAEWGSVYAGLFFYDLPYKGVVKPIEEAFRSKDPRAMWNAAKSLFWYLSAFLFTALYMDILYTQGKQYKRWTSMLRYGFLTPALSNVIKMWDNVGMVMREMEASDGNWDKVKTAINTVVDQPLSMIMPLELLARWYENAGYTEKVHKVDALIKLFKKDYYPNGIYMDRDGFDKFMHFVFGGETYAARERRR